MHNNILGRKKKIILSFSISSIDTFRSIMQTNIIPNSQFGSRAKYSTVYNTKFII